MIGEVSRWAAALMLTAAVFAAPEVLLPDSDGAGADATGSGTPGAEAREDGPLATPGYVTDSACTPCHRALAESYKAVGMSQAFYRPRPEKRIEDLDQDFYHQASKRHYRMLERDGRLFLRRWQVGPDGVERNVLEREVHWILGSGHSSRSYIHQTEWGELFQLPLAWYTENQSWGMAPGYDNADHKGFNRRVQRDCMFCHNAYPPGVAAGSDVYGEPQVFPRELPEGIGCQRCHGPGAEHVEVAFDPEAPEMLLRASIVNPGRLEPRLRDDVCMQCHLQPSVTLSGVRRIGRPMYSYRPGQPLSDYLVLMDVVEDRPSAERFEINHHPYRLRQSRCYSESEPGALSCLTCHDPHRKVPPAEAAAHYRAACLTCHDLDDCDLDAMQLGKGSPAADNCAACHMPRRRTEDVVQATMTDHRIRHRPGGPELTAPLAEGDKRLETVEFLEPDRAPEGREALTYRTLAMVRSGSEAALARLRYALRAAPREEISPYLELAVGQLSAGRAEDAEKTLAPFVERFPDHPLLHLHLGVALASQGEIQPAFRYLARAVELAPDRPEARYNLGKLFVRAGRPREALGQLAAALASRPGMAPAWLDLGNALAALGRFDEAAAAYRKALANDPRLRLAQHNLVEALKRLGRTDEAAAELRAWLHFEPGDGEARRRLADLLAGQEATGRR